ncbi:hypothetical protein TWF173_001073 [Orbilia oligospora]|nr:hypothetical protein TWF970_005305 [Orbilia oligospora]KAF3308610.1 hypothetical protein TWF173_001073 [Orbilia oligospora]
MEVVLIAGPIVNSLKVECSDWARMELGHTLSRLSAERNISTALYSISSYAALARRRAECWVLLQNQFPKLIPATTQPEPSLKPTQPSEDGSKVARRLLVANLPRRKMTFQGRNAFSNAPISSETEVCLYWHINVKTTGESYSNVSANIKVLSGDSGEIRVTQQMSNLFKVIVGEYGFMEGSSRLLDTIFGNS